MPRGIPKNGYRIRNGKKVFVGGSDPVVDHRPIIDERSDAEIAETLNERFDVLETLTNGAINGSIRAAIVSGPPGLGKSFTIERALADADPQNERSIIVKGFTRATGLYKTLYQYRNDNNVVVFDDCDSVFLDLDALNLLKGACDTTEKRTLSWGAETRIETDDGTRVPSRFTFNGAVIFVTNYDFDRAIASDHRLAPHFNAMMSRAHYIDMMMKTRRDYIVRIRQVVNEGLLNGFSTDDQKMIVDFISDNRDNLRELTIRTVVKIASLVRINRAKWVKIARSTMFRPEIAR